MKHQEFHPQWGPMRALFCWNPTLRSAFPPFFRNVASVAKILVCAWLAATDSQAASALTIVAWGNNGFGQTTVPSEAQTGVTAIAAGLNYTMCLKENGSVVAWGDNRYGQIDMPAALGNSVKAISAGGAHAMVLRRDGSVVAWGRNDDAQATVPATATNVTAIAAGYSHSAVLKGDGSVVVWGANLFGQTNAPADLNGVAAIAAGGNCTMALKSNGTVVVWGFNRYGQTNVPAGLNRVIAVAAGLYHNAALKSDGTVVAWGHNTDGQTNVPAGLRNVATIAAGGNCSMALKNDGTVEAWGYIYDGQTAIPTSILGNCKAIALGVNHSVVLATPSVPVPVVPVITVQPASQTVNVGQNLSFSASASGYPLSYQWRKDGIDLDGATGATCSLGFAQGGHAGSYTVVVSNILGSVTSAPAAVLTVTPALAGRVIVWGRNDYGQPNVPEPAQSGVTAIAIGSGFIVALRTNGTVVAWGDNLHGQTNVPPGLSGVTAIAAGSGYVVALIDDGTVVTWGGNFYGPATVPLAAQNGVTAIAAVGAVTVALKRDGTVVAWGYNYWGQVSGTRTTEDPERRFYEEANPVVLGGKVLSGVAAVAVGGSYTVALKRDGSVVAWGANLYGETDIPVAAQSGIVAIAPGDLHTVALKHDGAVVAWGAGLSDTGRYPNYGQALVPHTAQNDISLIAAGGYYSVALKQDETIVAWGYDGDSETAVPPGTVGVTAIAAFSVYSAAIVASPAPVARGQSIATVECTPAPITLTASASDGASLTFAIERLPEHGTLSGTPPNIVYTPAPRFAGLDTFSFTASDGQRRSLPTNIVITVRESQRVITAIIAADQLVALHPDFERPVLISCNWWNSCLKWDGSGSTSQDACGEYGALNYFWFVESDPVPFASGALVTNCLEVGTHTIILTVSDAEGLSDTDAKTIEVVTAPLAIELLIEKVNDSRVARKTKRELVATLRVALNHAGRERLRETQAALTAFEKKLRALVVQSNPMEATEWIRWSQAVSEGIENCFKPARKSKGAEDKGSKGGQN